MENVVDAGAGKQLEAVGDVVDDGNDAVGPIEAWLELPCRRCLEGGGDPLAKAKPEPVVDRVADLTMVLVVVALVDRLGLFEAVAGVDE